LLQELNMVVGVEDKTVLSLAAIAAVTTLQVVAWSCGHNGQVFALTSAIIGGITGFSVKGALAKKEENGVEWKNGNDKEL